MILWTTRSGRPLATTELKSRTTTLYYSTQSLENSQQASRLRTDEKQSRSSDETTESPEEKTDGGSSPSYPQRYGLGSEKSYESTVPSGSSQALLHIKVNIVCVTHQAS